VDRDYELRHASLASQRSKLEEAKTKEIEQWQLRKGDLDRQLESMQVGKYFIYIITIFSRVSTTSQSNKRTQIQIHASMHTHIRM